MTGAERKSTTREYYEALLIAVIFVNFARIFVFQAFKIPTGSMEDNLLVGDHIIVNKFAYGPPAGGFLEKTFAFRRIQRGDIVVFRFPEDPNTDFVKRVVALPNDTVTIRDKKVLINGQYLAEPYTIHDDAQIYPDQPFLPEPYRSRDQFGPYTVPEGKYFVMGDNRDRSNDSRYWGPVPRELIKGRAFLVYWSFNMPSQPEQSAQRILKHRLLRLRELLNVVVHFFSWTRWDRTFLVVDSEYHYHSDREKSPSAP